MSKERIFLFDTTLRDGAQTIEANFQLPDKLRIVTALDALGIDYVEAGFPGSNPVDTALFDALPLTRRTQVVAFGMTKRYGYSIQNDPGFQQVIRQAVGQVCIVGKSSAYHVRVALGIRDEENLDLIRDSLLAIRAAGHEAYLNCEHFFAGYQEDPAYTREVVRTAHQAGARWITLCDTNGGTLPAEILRIVQETCEIAPGDHLGIHAHNDCELAVANTFAAIEGGCRLVHGTINGLGERCGNANLTSIIPTILLKDHYASRYEIGVQPTDLMRLTEVSRMVDEILGRTPNPQAPFVGRDAFATKAGLHASALRKEPSTYEHVDPALVGNERRIVVASQAGRSNVLAALDRLGVELSADDDRIARLLDVIKHDEANGYAYDLGEASLDLRVLEAFGKSVLPPLSHKDGLAHQRAAQELGEDEFEAASRAVMALFDEDRTSYGKVAVALVELRSVDTGRDLVFRAVVSGHPFDQSKLWRTIGVGKSAFEAMFRAIDDSRRCAMMAFPTRPDVALAHRLPDVASEG
jgi:2-isopropylmalate synthase